ncbi:endonuclease exonuclease phosphatase family related protein [Cyclospora cayetanensis]|uniref:phosphoinositide 5-phosphatase n=1 Tax=Cyclospora cayetanensis TaxID=88456 RepID=A0A1D3CWC3_9EIME|nr:endonuclease exonuclease phosphatase family related protein [Cyclospora cayetanensis]
MHPSRDAAGDPAAKEGIAATATPESSPFPEDVWRGPPRTFSSVATATNEPKAEMQSSASLVLQPPSAARAPSVEYSNQPDCRGSLERLALGAFQGGTVVTPLTACKVELHPLHPSLATQGSRTQETLGGLDTKRNLPSLHSTRDQRPLPSHTHEVPTNSNSTSSNSNSTSSNSKSTSSNSKSTSSNSKSTSSNSNSTSSNSKSTSKAQRATGISLCPPVSVQTNWGNGGAAAAAAPAARLSAGSLLSAALWNRLEAPLQELGLSTGASLDFLDDDKDLLGLDDIEVSLGSAIAKTWGGLISAASDSLASSGSWGDNGRGGVASWVQQQTQMLLGPQSLGLLLPEEDAGNNRNRVSDDEVWEAPPRTQSSDGGSLEDLCGGGGGDDRSLGRSTAGSKTSAIRIRISEGGEAAAEAATEGSEVGASVPPRGSGDIRERRQRHSHNHGQKSEPEATCCSESDGNRYASAIEKLLSAGFYFSTDIELTRSLQRQAELRLPKCRQTLPGFPDCSWQFDSCEERDAALLKDSCWNGFSFTQVADERFSWNAALLSDWKLSGIDPRWTVPLIQGYVGYARVERLGSRAPTSGGAARVLAVELLLICRRSCRRGGTRYNARGIDDEGDVANFAESEQRVRLLQLESLSSSSRSRTGMPRTSRFTRPRVSAHSCSSTASSVETPEASDAGVPLLCRKGCCYGHWASMLQVRGSVPLFWCQSGLTAQTAVTRNALLTANAFERHLHMLHRRYGPHLVFINLLSTTRENERRLTSSLEEQLQLYDHDHLSAIPPLHIRYDFHSQTKSKAYEAALGDFVQRELLASAAAIGFFCSPCEEAGGAAAGRKQEGVFRTNCLDCLDRTNVFQWFYCWFWLTQLLRESRYEAFLLPVTSRSAQGSSHPISVTPCSPSQYSGCEYLRVLSTPSDAPQDETCVLRDLIKKMWADQGDSISLQYTGTGSVFSSQIKQGGKSSLSSNIDHAIKSIGRFYHNTFEDSFRQECVDLLVGQHRLSGEAFYPQGDEGSERQGLPVSTQHHISGELLSPTVPHTADEGSPVPLRIWIGTWNVAGRDIHEWDNLEDWLTPINEQADLFVFCVQELVELTGLRVLMSLKDRDKESRLDVKTSAGLQALAWTSPPPPYLDSRRKTLDSLQKLLRKSSSGSTDVSAWGRDYERSNISAYYCSVYSPSLLVSDVDATTVKVGMKGNAGNKGAVGVRLSLGGVSFSFLNVHLASGQTSSHERVQQMQLVLQQAFQTGSSNYPMALHHDFAFIAGDFNFRLHMSHQQVVEELNNSNFKPLLSCDQLYICKKHHVPPFNSLIEPPITFRPTYKYKRNSQLYDLKRTPAWCDRILYGGRLVPPADSRGNRGNTHSAGSPVQCLSYTHHQCYFSSDHKPVSGVFEVSVPSRRLSRKGCVRSRLWQGESLRSSSFFQDSLDLRDTLRPPSNFPKASLGAESASGTSSIDCTSSRDWTSRAAQPESHSFSPFPTLTDVDMLAGGVPLLLPERSAGPLVQTPSNEAKESNLLSLPASPRDGGTQMSTEGSLDAIASRLVAAAAADSGNIRQLPETATSVKDGSANAMDALDALLSNIRVENQQTGGSASEWSLLDLSQPLSAAPRLEERQIVTDASEGQQPTARGGAQQHVFEDLLL